MSLRVELTPQQEKEYAILQKRITQNHDEPALLGWCARCGKGIPFGHLALVVEWGKPRNRGGMLFAQPKILCCRGCLPVRKTTPAPAPPRPVMEIAQAVWRVLKPGVLRSSQEIAREIRMTDLVRLEKILQKLAEKSRLRPTKRGWRRA